MVRAVQPFVEQESIPLTRNITPSVDEVLVGIRRDNDPQVETRIVVRRARGH